jgi:hypothetical protein
MNDLADTTEHPPALIQAGPPRVNVHVDLHAISRDLQAIKSEIACVFRSKVIRDSGGR